MEIIPSILVTRWQEALKSPSIHRWAAVKDLALNFWLQANHEAYMAREAYLGYEADLATLADVALQHQLDLQPERIEYI
jgi:hypothetical protein